MKFTIATVLSLLVASATAAPLLGGGSNKPGVYHEVFEDLTCATQAPDYLTNSAEKTLKDCFAFCDSVKGCKFVNYYQDLGARGKPGLGVEYTCSAYSKVHDKTTATNCGGQSQIPFVKNTIINSSGYYKHTGLFGRD